MASLAKPTCNVIHLPSAVAVALHRDIPVFPCRESGDKIKAPYTHDGFKSATDDPYKITEWWKKYPDALIAMRTGKVSGYVVIDVDDSDGADGKAPKDGSGSLAELEKRYGKLPDTWEVLTPSGGRHFWFKHPESEVRNSQSKIGDGIDIRADGGYVIIPPSKGYQREISNPEACAEMPEWLIELCNTKRSKKANTKNSTPITISHKGSLWRERLSYLSRLYGFPAGKYEAEFIGWTIIKHPGQKLRKGQQRIEMRFRVFAASRHFEISAFHTISILTLPKMQGQISTGRCSQLAEEMNKVIGGLADDGFPIQINLDDINLDVLANKRLRVSVELTERELKSRGKKGGFHYEPIQEGYAVIRAITSVLPIPSVNKGLVAGGGRVVGGSNAMNTKSCE